MVVVALVLKRFVREWKWVLVLLLSTTIISQIGMAQDWNHGFVIVAITVVQCLVAAVFIVKVVRFNLLAYFIAQLFIPKVFNGIRLMESSMTWYDVNGAAVIFLGLLPLWVGIYFAVRSREAVAHIQGAG